MAGVTVVWNTTRDNDNLHFWYQEQSEFSTTVITNNTYPFIDYTVIKE